MSRIFTYTSCLKFMANLCKSEKIFHTWSTIWEQQGIVIVVVGSGTRSPPSHSWQRSRRPLAVKRARKVGFFDVGEGGGEMAKRLGTWELMCN